MAEQIPDTERRPRAAATAARGWLLGLVLVAAGAAALAAAWGPATHATPDSAMYLDAARQLAGGRGLVSARVVPGRDEPTPISAWPPGFPLLLSVGPMLGGTAWQAAAAVLFASYLAYGVLAYGLLLEVCGRRRWPLAAAGTLPVLLHPATLRGLDAILADLPFAALATGVLWLAVRLARSGAAHAGGGLALGLLAGAAVAVRWAGLFWVMPALVGLLAAPAPRPGHRERARLALGLALGLLAPVTPWLVRNALVTGSLAGSRSSDPSSPLVAAAAAAQGIFGALPGAAGVPVALLAAALLAGAVALVVGRAWRERALAPLLAVALGYPALMVASFSLSPFDPLSRERFWLPLWPVGVALLLAAGLRAGRPRAPVLAAALLGLAVALPATLSFALAAARGLPAARTRTGLADAAWADSAPLRFLATAGADCAVVSSEPRVHLLHGAADLVTLLPAEASALAPLLEDERALCIVVWFRRASGSAERRLPAHRALVAELVSERGARRVAGDAVGAVWWLAPRDR